MGKTSTIKFLIFIFSCLLNSCFSQKKDDDKCYRIFKKDKIKELTLIHGIKKNDTVLFILQGINTKKYNNKKCIFISEKIKKIESISSGNEIIYFQYKRKIIKKNIQLNVGSYTPGTKNIVVDSYYSLPFLLE